MRSLERLSDDEKRVIVALRMDPGLVRNACVYADLLTQQWPWREAPDTASISAWFRIIQERNNRICVNEKA